MLCGCLNTLSLSCIRYTVHYRMLFVCWCQNFLYPAKVLLRCALPHPGLHTYEPSRHLHCLQPEGFYVSDDGMVTMLRCWLYSHTCRVPFWDLIVHLIWMMWLRRWKLTRALEYSQCQWFLSMQLVTVRAYMPQMRPTWMRWGREECYEYRTECEFMQCSGTSVQVCVFGTQSCTLVHVNGVYTPAPECMTMMCHCSDACSAPLTVTLHEAS